MPNPKVGGSWWYDPVRPLLAIVRLFVGGLFLLSLLLNFSNVIGRYVFSAPINWAEEIMTFFMIGFVFVGMVLVTWENAHLRMDLFVVALPHWAKRCLNIFTTCAYFCVFGVVTYASFEVASMLGRLGRHSTAAEVPMMVPHGIIFIGFGLSLLAILWQSVTQRTKQGAQFERAENGGAGSSHNGGD